MKKTRNFLIVTIRNCHIIYGKKAESHGRKLYILSYSCCWKCRSYSISPIDFMGSFIRVSLAEERGTSHLRGWAYFWRGEYTENNFLTISIVIWKHEIPLFPSFPCFIEKGLSLHANFMVTFPGESSIIIQNSWSVLGMELKNNPMVIFHRVQFIVTRLSFVKSCYKVLYYNMIYVICYIFVFCFPKWSSQKKKQTNKE